MRYFNIKTTLAASLLAFSLAGCSDILDEEPRSIYEPGFFKTEKGVMGGLTSMYAHLRYIYGYGYYYNACQNGTDESTWGQSADGNFKDHDFSGVGTLTATTSRADALWNNAFPNINTASGIIENATEVGTISDALVAEARFFRAFDYFQLVQTFGGVPLDLGAGELKFNTTTSRVSKRNTVPEVYTKAIFPDLLKAVSDLPDAGRVTGGVTKTLARLTLAKAYLTYAWWLENPNNVPTYPLCDRVDPDGKTAQWYFQQAYDVAVEGIDNPGSFGLQPTYYDVNLASNDRNNEILLYADHTESSELYNGGNLSWGNGAAPENFAYWMQNWSYQSIVSSANEDWKVERLTPVSREAVQALGRPWVRMSPPIGVFVETFADKTNDSRYDGTFTTVYRGNWDKAGKTNEFIYNANELKVYPGEPILSFLDQDPVTPFDYNAENLFWINDKNERINKSGVYAAAIPGRADWVIAPSNISRRTFPGLWKLGMYRTDNGTGLGSPNGGSTRPFNIAKFSELYFVAAEAAVKGATTQAGKSARDFINVIRARAGKWRWHNNGNVAKVEDNSAAMVAQTPASITIDYILAERSREYYGEGYRWFDLVRTQTWHTIAKTYRICGPDLGDRTPITVERTITVNDYLRPIPQGQLDGMEMTPAEKKEYQNPVYQEQ